jgi:pilus assembly protein CpaE
MPLESVNQEQIFLVIELARQEFDTVYLDLPGNWTNWSLSLVARSHAILLVVELTIASLRQARRQLALLMGQGVEPERIHIIVNRAEKKLFRSIDFKDAENALAFPVRLGIANDFPLVSASLDQGVLIEDVKASSKICRDLHSILEQCVLDTEVETD